MNGILEELKAAVEGQAAQIATLAEKLDGLAQKVEPSREIYTIRDLAELPESPALKTLLNWRSKSPEKLPGNGKPDGFTRGSEPAWHRETVMAWRRRLTPMPFAVRGNPHIRELKKVPPLAG